MSVLLLDFESTGVDTAKDRITEIGAMVVSDDFKEVYQGLNLLVHAPDYPPLTQEVIDITGITPEMLKDAVAPELMMTDIAMLAMEYLSGEPLRGVVAYNCPFDKGLFDAEVGRQAASMLPGINQLIQMPWLCAMRDVEANLKCKSWKLMHVALDHGVTVNPKELHRAINDVELMRKMLVELGETFGSMLAYHNEPTVYVIAQVRPPWEDGGESSGIAKSLGFSWQVAKGDDTGRVIKNRWVKKIKQKDWVKLQETAPIKVALL